MCAWACPTINIRLETPPRPHLSLLLISRAGKGRVIHRLISPPHILPFSPIHFLTPPRPRTPNTRTLPERHLNQTRSLSGKCRAREQLPRTRKTWSLSRPKGLRLGRRRRWRSTSNSVSHFSGILLSESHCAHGSPDLPLPIAVPIPPKKARLPA